MKLLYATSVTFPSYRANRLQIRAMARAWTNLLKDNFVLGVGACADDSLAAINSTIMGEGIRSYWLAWQYLRYARREGVTHIYCREEKLLFFMVIYNQLFFKMPLAFGYELHHLVYMSFWWHRYILRHVAVVSITRAMKDVLNRGNSKDREVLVAPDAVDTSFFNEKLSREEARLKLKLPADKKIIIYTGAIIEPWKGVGVLYSASKEFGEDYLFLVLGGKPHYLAIFEKEHPKRSNFQLLGHKSHAEIPLYLRSADVAVLPNSKKSEVSRISTSPMKLFEYMASGLPIVASDLPSIREVLSKRNAVLVLPDDAAELAKGIRLLAEDGALAQQLREEALREVSSRTWEARAKQITDFLSYA